MAIPSATFTSMSSAFAVIPAPPPILNVVSLSAPISTSSAPPVNPVPATASPSSLTVKSRFSSESGPFIKFVSTLLSLLVNLRILLRLWYSSHLREQATLLVKSSMWMAEEFLTLWRRENHY